MPADKLIGIARLAHSAPELKRKNFATYSQLPSFKLLNRCDSDRVPFDWTINPYRGCEFGCVYCYARYTHQYMELRDPLEFETRIFAKQWDPAAFRADLRRTDPRESIAIGTATDPYQPAERRFRVTRGILEVLAEHPGLSVVIITKSPLITRDIDLLSRINRHSKLSIHISLITLDRELARRIEPRSPTPESRVRALARLREAGIDAGINCMPVLPGITDNPSDLEALVKRVSEAGATYVGACAVRLKSAARKRYLPFIEQEFPHLAERYRNTYGNSAYAGEKYREGLARFFEKLCAKYGVRGWSSREEQEEGDEALGALVPSVQLNFEI